METQDCFFNDLCHLKTAQKKDSAGFDTNASGRKMIFCDLCYLKMAQKKDSAGFDTNASGRNSSNMSQYDILHPRQENPKIA